MTMLQCDYDMDTYWKSDKRVMIFYTLGKGIDKAEQCIPLEYL